MKQGGAFVGNLTRPEHRQQDWILGMAEVVEITGVSRATLYTWMSQGIFPQASKSACGASGGGSRK